MLITKNINRFFTLQFLASLMLLLLCATSTSTNAATREQTLVIAKVSNNPNRHYQHLKPMVDYMVAHMQDLGIKRGKVVMARDNAHMLKLLKAGKVDWVTETLMSTALYQHQALINPLVVKWKKGVGQYHSILVVRKDSEISHLSDLKQKKLAFEDPGSTSAFYLPAHALIQSGLTLQRLPSIKSHPAAKNTGYLFSYQEINSATWLHKGLVDAIALSNLDWEKEDHVPNNFRKDMRIIYRSPEIPRAIESTRHNLAPAIKQRLKTVLLASADDPMAQAVLRKYQKTTRFSELTDADRDSLSTALPLIANVQKALKQ